jgi:NADH dehydrogenase FAD-containing subunit
MTRRRVVIAGLGDSGILTAIRLAKHADIVGISVKPALVSGQELGLRLSRPREWARDYWLPFDRLPRLDAVRTVHGAVSGVDLDGKVLTVAAADGSTRAEPYDVLIISTGVSNGFWRRPTVQSAGDIAEELTAAHHRLAGARSVAPRRSAAPPTSPAPGRAPGWTCTTQGHAPCVNTTRGSGIPSSAG